MECSQEMLRTVRRQAEMKNKQSITDFAKRFSYEDYGYLCTKPTFLAAVESGNFEMAEMLAEEYLFELGIENAK